MIRYVNQSVNGTGFVITGNFGLASFGVRRRRRRRGSFVYFSKPGEDGPSFDDFVEEIVVGRRVGEKRVPG